MKLGNYIVSYYFLTFVKPGNGDSTFYFAPMIRSRKLLEQTAAVFARRFDPKNQGSHIILYNQINFKSSDVNSMLCHVL